MSVILQPYFATDVGLGPNQTAKSLKGEIDRKQIAWTHHNHIQEQTIEKALASVINAYHQFELPKLWDLENRYP
jgi:TnpA family transposase